ncbi:uncharacterized protein LOC134843792 isoform X2 [Symsagittifera roscoffensis]|uniref:uncharacterized protein LOC134843792 isoform X2 n=1 Tax=Symsagittifera roscoffensis TaxID=84072 RepID=UPI00307B3B45
MVQIIGLVVVKMNLVISSVSLKDSGVVTCRCPKNGDRRSSLLAVQSPGVDLHVVIDGYSSLKPQLSRIETNNVGIVWFLDLRRLEYLDHFTGYVDCLQTSPICTNLPVLMDDKSAKFEAMSDRVGNGTRYTLTENTLFKQMGRFRCVCFEESSVTTEDGSTEPRSIKHWSQLVAIGRSPSPHPPSKTEVIAAETRKIVLSIPALYVYQWGFPTASIRWIKRDGTKELQISEEESGRVQFFYNDTSLLIPHAEAGDTGDYLCVVENDFARRVFGFKVKVIDKYSAVWPFFGLVLQVAFFSIAIIIYERHSKRQRSDSSD